MAITVSNSASALPAKDPYRLLGPPYNPSLVVCDPEKAITQ